MHPNTPLILAFLKDYFFILFYFILFYLFYAVTSFSTINSQSGAFWSVECRRCQLRLIKANTKASRGSLNVNETWSLSVTRVKAPVIFWKEK